MLPSRNAPLFFPQHPAALRRVWCDIGENLRLGKGGKREDVLREAPRMMTETVLI